MKCVRKPRLPLREDDPRRDYAIDADGNMWFRDGKTPEDLWVPQAVTLLVIILVVWCGLMLVLHLP